MWNQIINFFKRRVLSQLKANFVQMKKMKSKIFDKSFRCEIKKITFAAIIKMNLTIKHKA